MSARNFLERYIVPGLVIQAVMVGGGYATGRELVEFFVSNGPATGLLGMTVTATLFSISCMVAFELARRHHTFDYKSFCSVYLGRFGSIVFELGYFCSLLLVLAVIAAAAAKLLAEMFGSPELLNTTMFLLVVAGLVFFGNKVIERVISAWSVLFYAAYLSMFVAVWSKFGPAMSSAVDVEPIRWGTALVSGVTYTGFNISVLPILIFVARHFTTRSEALVAGALAGPLVLLPGFAFLLALSAFYPQIVSAPLPVSVVLEQLDMPWMSTLIQLVILGALFKTGAGLLHGVNERVARTYEDRGSSMPPWLRPGIALGAMIVAAYFATTIGLIDLIGSGYRYSSAFFLIVFLLPLLTVGTWQVLKQQRVIA